MDLDFGCQMGEPQAVEEEGGLLVRLVMVNRLHFLFFGSLLMAEEQELDPAARHRLWRASLVCSFWSLSTASRVRGASAFGERLYCRSLVPRRHPHYA